MDFIQQKKEFIENIEFFSRNNNSVGENYLSVMKLKIRIGIIKAKAVRENLCMKFGQKDQI